MRRLCNNLSPFLSLPVEILVHILRLTLDHSTQYPIQLLQLSLVCHYIHRIVKETPSLWAYLHSEFSKPVVTRMLFMSANSPLDVTIILSPDGIAEDYCILWISDTIERWRSASIWSSSGLRDSDFFHAMLQQPAPLLEALVVENSLRLDDEVTLFLGETPKLSLMRVDSVRLPWASLGLGRLHELAIRDPLMLSTQALLSILDGCPGLRRLELSRVENIIVDTDDSLSSSIHLPYLHHFSILDISHHAASQIIPRISAPVIQTFEVALVTMPGCDPTPLMGYITTFVRTARGAKSWASQAFSVILASNQAELRLSHEGAGTDSRLIGIFGSTVSVSLPLILQAINQISPEQAVKVKFEGHALVEDSDKIFELLWQMQNTIEASSLYQPEDQAQLLLDFLGTPRQSDRGVSHWPFPKLSILEIVGSQVGIGRMVERRYGFTLRKDAAAELPAPLRELKLEGFWTDDDVLEIEEIVGDGIVWWK